MQASVQIRQKLATLVGQIIDRCIQDARMIPTVLQREEVINILMEDPALFQKLVQDEHADQSQLSKEDLTVKLDAVAELAKLDRLETFEESFWDGQEVDIQPITKLTNQLTRTFAVYVGNAATLFDRAFEEFMDKFRQSLERSGLSLKTFDFTLDDVAVFEEKAISYLRAGDFLQAFTFERLLSSQIMMKQLVTLPKEDFSLREHLIRRALNDPEMLPGLMRFIIRVSYISQNSWDDLFPILAKRVLQNSEIERREQLIDFIEQDVFFSCNLLCRSYQEIRQLPRDQRRQAIESGLKHYKDEAESP